MPDARTRPTSRARAHLLLPREHGTYSELLLPIAAALAVGRPGAASWLLAVSAVAGYFAHEGYAVLSGLRGVRAQREDRVSAAWSLGWFGGVALLAGVAGLAVAPWTARTAVGVALVLSHVMLAIEGVGRERSIGGEFGVGVSLAAWGAPVALAGSVALTPTLVLWAIWSWLFTTGTLAVRCVIARTKGRPLAALQVTTIAIAAAGAVLLVSSAVSGGLSWLVGVAVAPHLMLTALLAGTPVHAPQLRRVGWLLVGSDLLALLLLVPGLRG